MSFAHRLPHMLAALTLLTLGAWLQRGALDPATTIWFALCLVIPVVHQLFTWTLWRAELAWGSLSRRLGPERAFMAFRAGFTPLLAARPVVLVGLACTDAGSLWEPGWVPLLGMPMERRGAFRWVPNTMYTLVFLGGWALALSAGSRATLIAAAFAHAAIWVHYLCLEKPDMQHIYSDGKGDLAQ